MSSLQENVSITVDAIQWEPHRYRCHVALLRDDDNTFTAVVLNLPGTASCGDTEADALQNVRLAAAASISEYLASGKGIPWSDSYTVPANSIQKWILVDVN